MFDLKFVSKIESAGGKCLLIGGAVIDFIKGLPIKDWDIEVYGLSYEELLNILNEFGEANIVGKSFGIIKVQIDGVNYDFSIPRIENRIGKSHRDFSCELVPNLLPEEAALRRDLTINSMYLDLHNKELIDPYNGLSDLKNGVIRATNSRTFREDPLRVLRIMQLLPRKGKTVESETLNLCRAMVEEFPSISKERVFEEWKKLLLLSNKPSIGLAFLRESHWIKWFPELEALIECRQNPIYHPEGDVWTHTLLAVDSAAQLKHKIPEEWQLVYMFSVLLHDVGKPETTDPDTLTAHGHDVVGEEIAKNFLLRLTDNRELINQVKQIVRLHMQPGFLQRSNSSESAWKRLHNKIRLDVLAMVSLADANATGGGREILEHKPSELSLTYFHKFGDKKIMPVLLGRHLIEAGYKPSPEFSKMLDRAYNYQIETGCEDLTKLLEIAISDWQ